ncbi:MAG: hypothetical protein Kow0080_05770 [Candidatus Promineifilaceae bacterium]
MPVRSHRYIALVLLAFLSLSCATLPFLDSGADDKLVYDGPPPEPGLGNVYGRILWNDAPMPNLQMRLCQDYSHFFKKCGELKYSTTTDQDGRYLFANIKPGSYTLSARATEAEKWQHLTDDFIHPEEPPTFANTILGTKELIVTAGETQIIHTTPFTKIDLTATHPAPNASIPSGIVTFSWNSYLQAAYYTVYLSPKGGARESILLNERINGTEVTVSLMPINCEYNWAVKAYNTNDTQIAETAELLTFTVTGADSSCHLTIQSPEDGEERHEGRLTLEWEPHPLAAYYKVLMWNDTDPAHPNILNFEIAPESRYHFYAPLPPARYVWSVYAYNSDDRQIATSEIYDFTIMENGE